MSQQKTQPEFGSIRSILFPIHRNEVAKFALLGVMMFFILFNYTILRDIKDTLVVGAAGGEALSLIKLIGTIPAAIVAMLIFSKLTQKFSKQTVFVLSVLPFLLFFALFAFAIYPNRAFLHPSQETIQAIADFSPRLRTFSLVLGNWSYALFYVLAELWGSVVLSLLFWQFANDIVEMKQAKRFYPLFGVIANFGAVGAGIAVQYFSKVRRTLDPSIDPWGYTLNYLMGAVVLCCFALLLTYWWMNRGTSGLPSAAVQKKERKKISLMESFRLLMQSKHLGMIALLVICYGISINVVEAVWKNEIKTVYGSLNDYSAFMGRFSMLNGFVTIFFVFFGAVILRKRGWLFSASLTPVIILVTGIAFFSFIALKDVLSPHTMAYLGMAPSAVAVWLGMGQCIMSKSTKYSLFDPTKEMGYIPLDNESKSKGKAAVDVVGARFGKSGGSLIQQALLLTTGMSLAELSPILGVVVIVTVAMWLATAKGLNKSLLGLQEEKAAAEPGQEEPAQA